MSGTVSYQGQSFDVTFVFSVILIDHHASAVFTGDFNGSDLADEIDSLAEIQFERVLELT